MITGIDHCQLAMPRGQEEAARRFYRDTLQMTELRKPAALAARGGCWFRSGAAELHLGVEDPFSPARKAHPALLTDNLDELEQRLSYSGHPVTRADGQIVRGSGSGPVRRLHAVDVFGNRLEFQQL